MPFQEKPRLLSIEDFEPDSEHDSLMDLIEITCGDDRLYAISTTRGAWTIDGATMPSTVTAEYSGQKRYFPSATGVKIDQARISQPLLLSLANFDWEWMWRSVNPVTALRPVQRHHSLRPSMDFPVEKNL